MSVILQINTTVNSGSTGRIAEDIAKLVMQQGHESYIAFGRGNRPSSSKTIRIGGEWITKMHMLKSRLLDRHGFGSTRATREFVKKLTSINPDIIHLHCIHGYYLNVEVLFNYLKQAGKPVVWTFHDCWPFTGHCSYFDAVNCYKWGSECHKCPNLGGYPKSWFRDNSKNNFHRKKDLFNGISNLTIVTPSKWLADHTKNSFLKEYPVEIIHNGVDLDMFKLRDNKTKSRYNIRKKNYILGVASVWDKRKGLSDFLRLRDILPKEMEIVLVGLNQKQISDLPNGITVIARTENVTELADLYSCASVFANPTYVDNFPTTNIEALACGTPVVTFNTGGSPEAIDDRTGLVVEKGDIKGLAEAIKIITEKGKGHYAPICRERAERLFNKDERFMDYLQLYESLI